MPGMTLKDGVSVELMSYFDPEKSKVRFKVRVDGETTEFGASLLELLEEACSLEAHFSDKKYEVYSAMREHLKKLACYFDLRSSEVAASLSAQGLKDEIL